MLPERAASAVDARFVSVVMLVCIVSSLDLARADSDAMREEAYTARLGVEKVMVDAVTDAAADTAARFVFVVPRFVFVVVTLPSRLTSADLARLISVLSDTFTAVSAAVARVVSAVRAVFVDVMRDTVVDMFAFKAKLVVLTLAELTRFDRTLEMIDELNAVSTDWCTARLATVAAMPMLLDATVAGVGPPCRLTTEFDT